MALNADQIVKLDAAHMSILKLGLPLLRDLTRVWPARPVIEAEHLHEIPTLVGEGHALRHIDYFRRMRPSYLEDLETLESLNPLIMEDAAERTASYEPSWAIIRAVLEPLPQWQTWREFD